MFHPRHLSLTVAVLMCAFAHAQEITPNPQPPSTQADPHVDFGTLHINVDRRGLGLDNNISETIIGRGKLRQRGANLGDALGGELGIHANGFGGGASAPIIRGQEGKRIAIVQQGSATLDLSAMSPDHAVTVDSILAHQIEVLRGANTVLYSSGNSAGVINVADNKIPTKAPIAPTGEVGLRRNSADDEQLINAAITLPLGKHFAAHAEALYRNADDYRTPNYLRDGSLKNRLDDSFSDAKSASFGLSWIGERGHLGAAFSQRRDRYGLPNHAHIYDKYFIDIIPSARTWDKPYLKYYPFLMEETDINYNNPGIQCKKVSWHAHSHLCDEDGGGHGHGHGHGHGAANAHIHNHGSPYISLDSKRVDLRGAWQLDAFGIDEMRLKAGFVDYHHQEKTDSAVDSAFKNRGQDVRLELSHRPIDIGTGQLKGIVGAQHTQQKTHALDPNTQTNRRQHLLQDHQSTNNSLFWLEQLSLGKWQFDWGARLESQKIQMAFNQDLGRNIDQDAPAHLKQPHTSTARSFVASANFKPSAHHEFGITLSHQERLPNAQELYAHGKHLATNSFDTGNKNLTKEISNNIELSYALTTDTWRGRVATYYNDFDNYIYLATLNNGICAAGRRCSRAVSDAFGLRVNRYNQSRAKIYGIEAEIGLQLDDTYQVSVFGDYVRGRLFDLPSLPAGYDYDGNPIGYRTQPDSDAPRMPAARLGVRTTGHWDNGVSMNLSVVHSFDQNRVAILERPTKGHTLVNAGFGYQGLWSNLPYEVFVNGHNLTNAKVYQHASFLSHIPHMGRSVSVGLNVKF